MKKPTPRRELINILKEKYGESMFLKPWEEFISEPVEADGDIWAVAEGDDTDENGLPLYDYYAVDNSEEVYIMGVNRGFHDFLEEKGWYVEFYDPGTVVITKNYYDE